MKIEHTPNLLAILDDDKSQFHRGHIMRKMQADSFAGLERMADKLSSSQVH
jgi:hypothetical protein